MKKKTWVVVASSAHARIFLVSKGFSFKELESFIHPESRMHGRDLYSERPGHGHQSVGYGRFALEPKISVKKQEFLDFAKLLAQFLETERINGSFERLYLAANPSFLGILRQSLDKPTAEMVEREVDKDITYLTATEIEKYFQPF